MDTLTTTLEEHLRKQRLLPRKATLVLAVSGGLDSMCLLHALHALQPKFGWRLEVAHFNHRLRGRESAADERLVQRTCAQLGLTCHTGRWDAPSRTGEIKVHGLEQAARLARRSFLGSIAKKLRARHVVMAHHADDQVELFFIRLLRGATSRGLAGMNARSKHGAPLNAWIVRPLLPFTRSELDTWAKTEGIPFREDASNDDPRFLRNRVRHHLLPQLRREFPSFSETTLRRTMQSLADDAAWLREEAVQYLKTPAARRPDFAACHPSLQRQVLAVQLEGYDVRFDWELIERLRTQPGTIINAAGNQLVSRDDHGRLHRVARSPQFEAASEQSVNLEDSGTAHFSSVELQWSIRRKGSAPAFGPGREFLDAGKVGPEITLRHWRPGDRFQPLGFARPTKLQDLFTNAKVPRSERVNRVIATNAGGEIFWVEGLRPGESFKLTPSTRTVLKWEWQRE